MQTTKPQTIPQLAAMAVEYFTEGKRDLEGTSRKIQVKTKECPEWIEKMVFDAQTAMAQSLDALGRDSDAAAVRLKARAVADTIAEGIVDAEIRGSFQQGAEASLAPLPA